MKKIIFSLILALTVLSAACSSTKNFATANLDVKKEVREEVARLKDKLKLDDNQVNMVYQAQTSYFDELVKNGKMVQDKKMSKNLFEQKKAELKNVLNSTITKALKPDQAKLFQSYVAKNK